MHPAPRTLYLVPHAPYPVPRTSHLVPRTSHPVSRTSYLVLCTSISAPSTSYRHISGTSLFCWIIIQSVLHLVPRALHHVLRTLHHVPHTSHLIPHTMYHVPHTHARHAKKSTSIRFVSYLKHACIYKAKLNFCVKLVQGVCSPHQLPLWQGGSDPTGSHVMYIISIFACALPADPTSVPRTTYHVSRILCLVPRTSNFVPCTSHHAHASGTLHLISHSL